MYRCIDRGAAQGAQVAHATSVPPPCLFTRKTAAGVVALQHPRLRHSLLNPYGRPPGRFLPRHYHSAAHVPRVSLTARVAQQHATRVTRVAQRHACRPKTRHTRVFQRHACRVFFGSWCQLLFSQRQHVAAQGPLLSCSPAPCCSLTTSTPAPHTDAHAHRWLASHHSTPAQCSLQVSTPLSSLLPVHVQVRLPACAWVGG